MVHRAKGHLCADLLSHRDQRNSEHSRCLMKCVFILFVMFSALMEHFLDFKHIASARVGAGLDQHFQEFCELRLHELHCLEYSIAFILLAEVNKPQRQTKEPSHRVLQRIRGSFHQGLDDTLCDLFVAAPNTY